MRSFIVLVALLVSAPTLPEDAAAAGAEVRVLRVCADPNNYPFTDERGQGFENRIAELVARDLDARIEYTWWAQRRGFLRKTIKAGKCDVVLGVPAQMDMLHTTRPYYRSAYAFVTREDRALDVRSLSDPRLATLSVGVQVIGDDGSNAPPAHVLASRGVVDNVKGYSVLGDYTRESPPAEIVRAVARGDIDIAIVWGPLAGAFAKRSEIPLTVTPLAEAEAAGLPMAFDIAVGVRHGDEALAEEIDRVLRRRRREIRKILQDYGVPLLPRAPAARGGR